jgi:putative transposase
VALAAYETSAQSPSTRFQTHAQARRPFSAGRPAPFHHHRHLYDRRRLLDATLKARLVTLSHALFAEKQWGLEHWVVLDNHYHLIAKSREGSALPGLIRDLHSKSAQLIRERTRCATPVWYNYWDDCLRDERDYYRHLDYLLWNPVKHGYVQNLNDWPFSSFHELIAAQGREHLVAQFKSYPDFRGLDLDDDD